MSRLHFLIAIMVVVIALFIFSRITANSPEKQVEKLAFPAPSALDEATNQLLRMGEKSVPALIKAVDENKNPNVRFRAARILGLLGPVSKDAVPILIKNLKDDDVELRCNIVEALGLIGPEPGVIEALVDTLENDTMPEVRSRAAYRIGYFESEVIAEVIPQLRKAFMDDSPDVRDRAAQTLACLGVDALPCLIDALSSKNYKVRQWAAYATSLIGPDALDAVPALVNAMSDQSKGVRWEATEAIVEIGPKATLAIPKLRAILRDRKSAQHDTAAKALGAMGPETGATYEMVALLDKAEGKHREAILVALANYGKASVPALTNALGSSSYQKRVAACDGLGMIGSDAKAALPKLRSLAENDRSVINGHFFVRDAAKLAIELIEKEK